MKRIYTLINAFGFTLIGAVLIMNSCVNKTYNTHNHLTTQDTVLVKDTAEVKRWKAESKRFEKSAYDYQQKYYAKCREVKQLRSVKIDTVIIDTNWLAPRFYFVDHPDSIRINKRIEKFRQEDKKDWDMIEYRWEQPWRPTMDSLNKLRRLNVRV